MDIFPFGAPEFSLPPGDATVQQEYYESRARRDAYIQLFWVSFDGQPAQVFALRRRMRGCAKDCCGLDAGFSTTKAGGSCTRTDSGRKWKRWHRYSYKSLRLFNRVFILAITTYSRIKN